MEPIRLLAEVVFAFCGTAYLVYLGVGAVRYARRASPGAHVLGAAILLMGFGNIQDPANEMVQIAKQKKQSEQDDSGDPPDRESQAERPKPSRCEV